MRASEDARAYPVQIGGHLIQRLEPKSYGKQPGARVCPMGTRRLTWHATRMHGRRAMPGPSHARANPEHASAPWAREHLTWHATSTVGRRAMPGPSPAKTCNHATGSQTMPAAPAV